VSAASFSTAVASERRPDFGFRFVTPLALGSVLNPINSTMISTALVPIATQFHATAADTGWLIASLYLTSAVAQPTMGRLADLFGPRRVYLASLWIVFAAGVASWFAPSLDALIVVRVMLGVGTSGAYPAAMSIFRTQADRLGYAPPRKAMGVLSLAAIATAAIGPLLGGVLTMAFGWPSIFTVNAPLALFVIALVLSWVPKDEPRDAASTRRIGDIDVLGIVLFAGFLLSAMLFVMDLHRPRWFALPVSVALLATLVVHSMRRARPFIDVRMLAHNRALVITYIRAALISTIVYCVFYGFAQWLERSAGYSSAAAGLMTLPMSVIAAVSSLTGARTKGIRAPFLVAIASALAGCVCLSFVDSATSVWPIAAAVAFFGAPQGLASTTTQAAVYLQAPPGSIGTAAGLQRTAMYIGAISATSLLSLMYADHATDSGFHGLALVMGVLSAALFVATLFDRTLPRGAVGR
jgi:MFS family permease